MEYTETNTAILEKKEKTINDREAWIFHSILQRRPQEGVGTLLGTSTKYAPPTTHDTSRYDWRVI